MAATHSEILVSFLAQLDRLDQRVGYLLRANRRHIAVTTKQVADSHAQIARTEARERRQAREDRALLTRVSRRRSQKPSRVP